MDVTANNPDGESEYPNGVPSRSPDAVQVYYPGFNQGRAKCFDRMGKIRPLDTREQRILAGFGNSEAYGSFPELEAFRCGA